MITLGNKKDKKKKKGDGKYSRLLTYEQRSKYNDIGVPDPSQNWLEIFTPDLMHDLRTIMRSCSDNQLKYEYLKNELSAYGFEVVGLGTNIATFANPLYSGVVFKIALDDYGIADNFNDCVLQDVVPKYNRVFARDPSAMISVQERLVLMTPAQREMFTPRILALLKELSKHFLIADLSPDMYLNYGITRDGDYRIIDGSDLYPLHQMKDELRCTRLVGQHKKTGEYKHCEGKLKYSPDYKMLICQKCGREYNPLELRPRKDVEKLQKILSDGMSAEERAKLEEDELRAIANRGCYAIPGGENVRYDRSEIHRMAQAEGSAAVEPTRVPFSTMTGATSGTVFVVPDDETPPADDGDIAGDEGAVPVYGEGEPARESSQSDEDGESEAMQDDGEDDGIPSELHKCAATIMKPHKTGEDQLADIIDSLIAGVRWLKRADEAECPGVKAEFDRLMRAVFAEEFEKQAESAGMDISDEEDDSEPKAPDAQAIYDMVMELKTSSAPADQGLYLELVELFGASTDTGEAEGIAGEGVQNDAPNMEIHQQAVQEDASVPHITYSVVNETGSTEVSTSKTPGIYLDIYGDLDEAYEASGLPIYVSLNGDTNRFDMAINGYDLLPAIKATVDDILAEYAMYEAQAAEAAARLADGDDSDSEDDE